MKKRISMGIIYLATVMARAAFMQKQGKYYLEIWNISKATYDNLESRNKEPATFSREDGLVIARTASGSILHSKDSNLSLEHAKQKLLDIAPQVTDWVNATNNIVIPTAHEKWGINGWWDNESPQIRIYYWIRRTE